MSKCEVPRNSRASHDRITIACRVKPREPGGSACTSVREDQRTVAWAGHRSGGATPKNFKFDYAAGERVNQEELFEKIGRPFTHACMTGLNGTIFCYGQTGSGKTYTTFGPPDEASCIHGTDRGLVPRVLEYLLHRQPGGQGTSGLGPSEVQICRCSFYEIYNEQVYDLTVPEGERVSLNVREAAGKGIFLEGLLETEVKTAREACAVLRKGYASRHTASTAMNSSSSRSHAIFTLVIDTTTSVAERPQSGGDLAEKTPGVSTRRGSGKKQAPEDGSVRLRSARFNLVDLAGSERQRKTQAGGAMLKEAASINKSLSALGRVIKSLVEGAGSGHVPYRDSKLTRLLAHSLGGNSKTVLIATVSGDVRNASETLSTLEFVQRAKMIKNRTIRNVATHSSGPALQQENAGLKKLLADQEHLLSQARLKLREADAHRSHLATEMETLREEAKRNKETALEAWEQLSERQSKLEELQNVLAEKEHQLEGKTAASPQGGHLVARRLRFGSNGSGGSGGLSRAGHSRQGFLSSPVTFDEREEGSRDGVSSDKGADGVDKLGDWKDVDDGDLVDGGGVSDEMEAVPLATLQRVSPSPSVGGGDQDSPEGEGGRRDVVSREDAEADAAAPTPERSACQAAGLEAALGNAGASGSATAEATATHVMNARHPAIIQQQVREHRLEGDVPPPNSTSPPQPRGGHPVARRLCSGSGGSEGNASRSRQCFVSLPVTFGGRQEGLRDDSNKRDEIAEPCQRWSLQIHDELYGSDHVEVARDLAKLAKTLMEKGDFDAAEPVVRSALEIRSRFLGPAHADVACSLFDLARIYRIKGNRQTADLLEAEGNLIWGRAFIWGRTFGATYRHQEDAPPERRAAVGTE